MSCAARHGKNVLCFECYKSRLDVKPERRTATVTLFPDAFERSRRTLTDRELAHRRAMLLHLTVSAAQAGREAASHLRTFGRTSAPSDAPPAPSHR